MGLFGDIPEPTLVEGEQEKHVGGWLSSKPNLALVANDERGNGIVLFWVGPDFYLEIYETGLTDLDDLGLDDAPVGLSVWEGHYARFETGSPLDGPGECSTEAKGTFRDLTDEEWAAVRARRSPWNKNEWLIPEAREEP